MPLRSHPLKSHPWSAGFESQPDEHDYRVEDIDGTLPGSLRGTLFRNGSGRNDLGGHWFAHWFDGDGMISKIRFDDAGIHYRSRYVAPRIIAMKPRPAGSSIAASARCGRMACQEMPSANRPTSPTRRS